jgi:hypothetical protein
LGLWTNQERWGDKHWGRHKWIETVSWAWKIQADNIKEELRYIGIDGVNGIHVAQDRYWRGGGGALANTVMKLRAP